MISFDKQCYFYYYFHFRTRTMLSQQYKIFHQLSDLALIILTDGSSEQRYMSFKAVYRFKMKACFTIVLPPGKDFNTLDRLLTCF